MAGRGIASIGAVLAIVGIFVTALGGQSYWDIDGTLAAFGLAAAILAALCVLLSFAGRQTDGWLAGLGALMVGYFGWFPAATAFDDWDRRGQASGSASPAASSSCWERRRRSTRQAANARRRQA